MAPLILASQSPRRAKILRDLGVAFSVVKTDAAEVSIPHAPEETVVRNAVAKCEACRRIHPEARVLAADTIVWFADRIYGKPRDLDEATTFLKTLSGRTHCVFTGVAYWDGAELRTACARSGVTFNALSDALVAAYVARVRPTDRAGAYDIDASGDLIVASYDGEYENVMGLPVKPLREWGVAS